MYLHKCCRNPLEQLLALETRDIDGDTDARPANGDIDQIRQRPANIPVQNMPPFQDQHLVQSQPKSRVNS